MYDLGARFKLGGTSSALSECVFKGEKYRITVLTERLVRLEYNELGVFEDCKTETVWNRNFPKPKFEIEDNNKILKISTEYFELLYFKNRNFLGSKFSPSSNLKISLKNTDKFWYYNHPEVRNYNSSIYKLNNDKLKHFQKSLYSIDGFVSIDDSKSNLILEDGTFKNREKNLIDVYVFLYNKDFYKCLNDYFTLTGYPPLIPKYALGNWWAKNEQYNGLELNKLSVKFEKNEIPISVILLNNWNSNDKLFEFNDNFKDPKMMISYLNSKGIKVALDLKYINEFNNTIVEYNKLKNYLEPTKNGLIPFNVLNPRTIDAFLKLLIHPIDNFGVSFYNLASYDKKKINDLAILKHYLYYDSLKIVNKRPMLCSYNYEISSHRYSVLYGGSSNVSWDSLKSIPLFNASNSNLGISWCSHDFGGTTGGIEDGELFTRYIQLGVFSPILRLGSESGKYYKREPWKWGMKTSKIVKDYLNLRYKLIPYIYTEAYKYFKYGKPLIEPIYYRYPLLFDDVLYKNEYFFGSDIFISPIINKKDYVMNRVIHKLFLPKGKWYEFSTGKRFTGDKKYVSFYKDEEYPIFVKSGAIIPMSNNKLNDVSSPTNMEIQIFPGESNTYSIYEDDGETNGYLNGEYLITNVEYLYKKDHYNVTILPVEGKVGIVPKTRNYKIVFRNTRHASKILTYSGSNQIQNENHCQGTDLIIMAYNVPTNIQFTILCSGDNIEIDAIRIINEEIVSIISDLPIKTTMKEKIDIIMFSTELTLKKKRIEIRKLAHTKDYLEKKYVQLFLKLLEYINEV